MKNIFNLITFLLLISFNNSNSLANTNNDRTDARIGIYITNIDRINIKDQSFYAEFYLNIKWRGKHTAKNFEFVNANKINKSYYEEWEDGGFKYLSCKVSGIFRSEMDEHRYPFDNHRLKIILSDYAFTTDSIEYTKNDTTTGISKNLNLMGWKIKNSTYGIKTTKELDSTFPIYEYEIEIARNKAAFIIKIFIPILIVICVAYLNFYLPKVTLEACVSLGVTSLLSLIAFYFSISGQLPDVEYVTRFDLLMIFSYTIILLSLIEPIIINRLQLKSKWAAKKFEIRLRLAIPVLVVSAISILFIL